MTDETPAAQQQLSAPPTQNASQFILTANQSEFLLSFGHTRILPAQDSTSGLVTGVPLTKWFMTISFNPAVAELLKRSLEQGISEFEKAFGKIPASPTFPPQVSRPAQKTKPKAKE